MLGFIRRRNLKINSESTKAQAYTMLACPNWSTLGQYGTLTKLNKSTISNEYSAEQQES